MNQDCEAEQQHNKVSVASHLPQNALWESNSHQTNINNKPARVLTSGYWFQLQIIYSDVLVLCPFTDFAKSESCRSNQFKNDKIRFKIA